MLISYYEIDEKFLYSFMFHLDILDLLPLLIEFLEKENFNTRGNNDFSSP